MMRFAYLALAALLFSCSSSDPSTAFIVTTDATPDLRASVQRVEIEVVGLDSEQRYTVDRPSWPLVTVLAPQGGQFGRTFEVFIDAFAGGRVVASGSISGGFQPDQVRRERVLLQGNPTVLDGGMPRPDFGQPDVGVDFGMPACDFFPESVCGDLDDNDGDGCVDEGCEFDGGVDFGDFDGGVAFCGESPEALCFDGVDNDMDSCLDEGCLFIGDTCTLDRDCASNVCVGTCAPCEFSEDCAPGFECFAGVCAIPCGADGFFCGAGEVCIDGFCELR
ncbi:MAG: hypothetical protein AAF645_26215 [Myxococcota bacterium]